MMKKIFSLAVVATMCGNMAVQAQAPQLNANNIDEVVQAMTLEEKVHMVLGCGMSFGDDVKFPGTAGRTYAIPRLGIRPVYLADGPHRLIMNQKRPYDSNTYITTEFPSSTTVAATFDTEAAKAVGTALGREVKDYGLDVLLAPGINLMRSPLCGRNHEYYSEDPVLTGKMAAGYIKGIQSNNVGTSLKHFAVNSQETNRNKMDSRLTPRPLRELYLKGFEIAVREAAPWTIMTSYNKVNGRYTCEDIDLTEKILRDEWGFKGLVMSDWNAGTNAVISMIAGNDMMQPGQQKQYNDILEAAKSGKLPMSVLDRSVRRTLELVVRCNSFNDYRYANRTDFYAHAAIDRKVGAEGIVLLENNNILPLRNTRVALYGVTSYSMVPAGVGFGSVNVGYYCVSLVEGMRGAGYTVDNSLVKKYTKHLADEEKRLFPKGRPSFTLTPLERPAEFIPSAEDLATQVADNDVAIITLGRTSGEGADRRIRDFELKAGERELIETLSKAYHADGKKVVVVLNICSPMEVASWRGMVDAVVCAFQPGQEAGNCVADVLSGKVNPSGKLPMTFAMKIGDAAADKNFPNDMEFRMPNFAMGTGMNFKKKEEEIKAKVEEKDYDYTLYEEGVYVGYRYFDTFNKQVAYPFGYGKSYTTFDYSLKRVTIEGNRCVAEVKVSNTGSVAGREAVQLYIAAPKGRLDKPIKELKAFAKTRMLAPGASETLTLTWNLMDMASFNEKVSAWDLAKGDYTVMVAASSADVRDEAVVKVPKSQRQKVHRAMLPKVKITNLTHK